MNMNIRISLLSKHKHKSKNKCTTSLVSKTNKAAEHDWLNYYIKKINDERCKLTLPWLNLLNLIHSLTIIFLTVKFLIPNQEKEKHVMTKSKTWNAKG